jgi:hypothetical protein
MHPRRSIGKSRVCRTGNAPVATCVQPFSIRAPPCRSLRRGWAARVCRLCVEGAAPNLGIIDRGGARRGDARYDRASMQRYACRATTRPDRSRTPTVVVDQATMGRRHFRPRLFRGVNEDREAINRMTVICPSTTLRDFAMIERAPVREPVRVCPKCDDRTRKTTSAPGQGRGASAAQVEPSAMDLEESKSSRDRPNQMREGKQDDERQRRSSRGNARACARGRAKMAGGARLRQKGAAAEEATTKTQPAAAGTQGSRTQAATPSATHRARGFAASAVGGCRQNAPAPAVAA